MNGRIKLGPLAVFIVIVAIIMSVLALLTFVTSKADMITAEKYASVTGIKYELDKKGNEFLCELDDMLKNGGTAEMMEGVSPAGKGLYRHTESVDIYTLTVDFEVNGDSYSVNRWKISREWQEDDSMGNLWQRPLS